MKNPTQARQQCGPRAPKEQTRQRSSNTRSLFKIPVGQSKKATSIPRHSSESSSRPNRVSSKVMAIANTMKIRMKAAVNTMLWNTANNFLPHAVSPSFPPTSSAHANVTPLPSNDRHPLPTLKNHILLKQYLAFVEKETGSQMEVDPSPETTSSTLKSHEHYASHPLSSSGASLIEYMVHQHSSSHYSETETTPTFMPQPEESRPYQQDNELVQPPVSSAASLLVESTSPAADSSVIRCICDEAHEEFGAMVQCDDCTLWLHLECLEMDEDSLGESFRCPFCYITLGEERHITTSPVSWRFAAYLRSERLASRYKRRSRHRRGYRKRPYDRPVQQTDDENDSAIFYQPPHQKATRRRPRYDRQSVHGKSFSPTDDYFAGCETVEYQQRTYDIPKMTIDPSISTTMTNSTGNVLYFSSNPYTTTDTEALDSSTTDTDNDSSHQHDNLRYQQPRTESLASATPSLTASRGGSDTDTPSDVSTLDDGIRQDVYLVDTTTNCLDQDFINKSSWMAYMESLHAHQTVKSPGLAAFASDVFMGRDPCFSHNPSTASFPVKLDAPPSTLCFDQLHGLSFATGPFWSTPQ